jgi:hypothetical protein
MTEKNRENRVYSPIIEQQATWIVVNPVQGCPKRCRYCFLGAFGQINVSPQVISTTTEAIEQLCASPYYSPTTPLCFLTHTDPMATPANYQILLEMLWACHSQGVWNPKCFVTKCSIPEIVLEQLVELQQKGHSIIVYLSFSGLDNSIELGINHQQLQNNFISVSSARLPIIHYWRPFLPQNSSRATMLRVLSFVAPLAQASVVTGLKLYEGMHTQIDFWPSLQQNFAQALKAEGIWPEGVLNFLAELPEPYQDYPIFQSNSCALSYVLQKPDMGAFFETPACQKYNCCPVTQRLRCKNFYQNYVLKQEQVETLLHDFGITDGRIAIEREANHWVLKIHGVRLHTEQIAAISHRLHCRIEANLDQNDLYWRSSVVGARPLEWPLEEDNDT